MYNLSGIKPTSAKAVSRKTNKQKPTKRTITNQITRNNGKVYHSEWQHKLRSCKNNFNAYIHIFSCILKVKEQKISPRTLASFSSSFLPSIQSLEMLECYQLCLENNFISFRGILKKKNKALNLFLQSVASNQHSGTWFQASLKVKSITKETVLFFKYIFLSFC